MSIPASYLGVIIIWATTPIAIKWSGEHAGFLFGVSARMALGAVICVAIIALLRRPLPWDKRAWQAYFSVSMGIFGAMSSVYWAAQFIPSGLISVIFGITPLLTAILAWLLLGEQALTPSKILGLILGLAGLYVIFAQPTQLHHEAWKGLLGVLLSTFLHSLSAVMIKRSDASLPALQLTTGGLLVSLPMFALAWLVTGQTLPNSIPLRGCLAIVYLGVFGSVIGFMLYFYLLRHVAVSKVALITLITPICALLIGQTLNHEPLTPAIIIGSSLVLSGLALHQWGANLYCQPLKTA